MPESMTSEHPRTIRDRAARLAFDCTAWTPRWLHSAAFPAWCSQCHRAASPLHERGHLHKLHDGDDLHQFLKGLASEARGLADGCTDEPPSPGDKWLEDALARARRRRPAGSRA